MIILSIFLALAPINGIETVMTLHAGPFQSVEACSSHASRLISQAVDVEEGDEVHWECLVESDNKSEL